MLLLDLGSLTVGSMVGSMLLLDLGSLTVGSLVGSLLLLDLGSLIVGSMLLRILFVLGAYSFSNLLQIAWWQKNQIMSHPVLVLSEDLDSLLNLLKPK